MRTYIETWDEGEMTRCLYLEIPENEWNDRHTLIAWIKQRMNEHAPETRVVTEDH